MLLSCAASILDVMVIRRWVLVVAIVFGLSDPASAEGPKIAPSFSQAQARKIALARVPGTVIHEKLKLKKRKPPVYSIKIRPRDGKPPGMLVKVEIDGLSGVVLKVKPVKPRDPIPKDDGDDE